MFEVAIITHRIVNGDVIRKYLKGLIKYVERSEVTVQIYIAVNTDNMLYIIPPSQ